MTATDPTTPRRPRPLAAALLITAALGFHAWESLRLFPTWDALTRDDVPVVMVDHAIHLYHGAIGARAVREAGRTWAYDPFFMAGYPETPVWDSSSNLAILSQLAAGGRYSPRAYNRGLLFWAIAAGAALPLAARAAGLSWGEAASASVLGVLVFWACVPAVFWRTGLFAFVTASALFPLVLGLALAFARRPDWRSGVLLTAAGAVWLFAHVTAPVMLLGAATGLTVALAVARRGRVLAALAAAGLVAVAVNAFWLVPLWNFREIRTPSVYFLTFETAGAVLNFYRDNALDARINLGLLVLAAAGVLWWAAEPPGAGGRTRAAAFGPAAAWLIGLTVFGGTWALTRTLEPFRFLAALDLVLVVPAASFLTRAGGWLVRLGGGGRRGALVATAAAVLAAVGLGAASGRTFVLAAEAVARRRPLVAGLRPADAALVDWLKTETDGSARVLLEDQLRLFEATDAESTHWTPLLPMLLADRPRAFVGGLYQTAFIAHHRAASFGDFVLGGRRVNEWSAAELTEYCDRFNVGWVVCWSPLSRFMFDTFPLARKVGTLPRPASPGQEVMRDETQWRAVALKSGPEVANRYLTEGVTRYALYRIDRAHSFALEGRARVVSFGFDRVELADVEPDPSTGRVVLSLHWLDAWRSDPPVPLAPLGMPGDAVPLVSLRPSGPVARLILQNGHRGP